MSSHRLFIDLQAAQSIESSHLGLGRYAIEFTRALIRNHAPIDSVGLNPLLPRPTLPADIVAGARVVGTDAEAIDRARARGPVAFHMMSPMQAPYAVECVLPRAIERADALVMVAYDLIPFLFADPYLMRDGVEQHGGRLRRVKTADLLLAISERTRLDFIEHLGVDPDRIVNIGAGVSDFFTPAGPHFDAFADATRAVPGIDRPFIMSVPSFQWRKNAENLIRAFARSDVRDGTQLVIACEASADAERAWRQLIGEVGLHQDDVVITGFVADTTLRTLYRATSLFVFPSRYEGFGLPVAEAARCGAPCITSDRGSLNEVLDLASSTFDPEDVDEMASLIDRALTDQELRRDLIAASVRSVAVHSWDKTAQRAIAAYERLTPTASPRRSRERKPLVAIVGPMPPVASPIAEYTARVLDEIDEERLDIDVYADSAPIGAWPPSVKARRLLPAAALGTSTNPHDYDAIVYCLGSSAFHIDTLDALRRWPGIVWAHDTDLVGVYREWAERFRWGLQYGWRGERAVHAIEAILHDEARAAYGDRLPQAVTYAACAVANAKHVIVNSSARRELIVEDLAALFSPRDTAPAISVLADDTFVEVAAQLVEIIESTIPASSRAFILAG